MKIIGPILLSAIASLAACSDASSSIDPDETSADEIDPAEVPLLDEQYGVIVSSAMTVCKTGESPCPAGIRVWKRGKDPKGQVA